MAKLVKELADKPGNQTVESENWFPQVVYIK